MTTSVGIITRMIQAPSAAFVVATMISTIPVTSAPKPLMAALVRQPGRPQRAPVDHHPACDRVNDTNTPIM